MNIIDIVASKIFWIAAVQWSVIAFLPAVVRIKMGGRIPVWALMMIESILLLGAFVLILGVPLWLFNLLPLRGEKIEPYLGGVILAAVLATVARMWMRRKTR